MIGGDPLVVYAPLAFVLCYAVPSACVAVYGHTGNAWFSAVVGGLAGMGLVSAGVATQGTVPNAGMAAVLIALGAYGVEIVGLGLRSRGGRPMSSATFSMIAVPQAAFCLLAMWSFVQAANGTLGAAANGDFGLGAFLVGLEIPLMFALAISAPVVFGLLGAAPLYAIHHRQVIAEEAAGLDEPAPAHGRWRV